MFFKKLKHHTRFEKFISTMITIIMSATFLLSGLPSQGGLRLAAAEGGYDFITKWGSQGSANGQFNNPAGVDVDSSGNVYVADYYNHRIQKFDANGNFITKWGTYGTGEGQFNAPSDVTVDADGNVYAVDLGNHRIQKFNSDGSFITKWGSSGSGDGQFSTPGGVGVDSAGNVYVTDLVNHRIQKFTSTGVFITKWGLQGSGDGQFNYPRGIDVDSSGNVYVIEQYGNRIQKFDSNGNFITKWGSYGTGDGQLNGDGIGVDSAGYVYVADTYNNRIQKFDSNGNFLTNWGSAGTSNGQFIFTFGVAVDSSGDVYVADANNHRIQKFSPTPPDTTPPDAFTLSQPDEGAIINKPYPLFSWNPSSDSGSGLAKYQLYIDGVLARDNITNWTAAVPPAPLTNGSHTWFVRAWDNAGNFRDSETRNISVDISEGKIAFVSNRDNGNYDIYVMNADGSEVKRLTDDPAMDIGPNFSPDGDKIIFSSNRSGKFESYIMNADGTGVTQLMNFGRNVAVRISPDGTKILYDREDKYLYTANIDGTNEVQIPNTYEAYHFEWGPDGSKVIFAAPNNYPNQDVFIVDIPTGNKQNLTLDPSLLETNPSFRPDGEGIAYVKYAQGTSDTEIHTMNVDGSNDTPIIPAQVSDPNYSLDGSKISYNNDSNGDIYIANADGSNPVNITPNTLGSVEYGVSWAPGSVDATVDVLPIDWIRQFGSAGTDHVQDGAVDSSGNSYSVGWTGGTLPGKVNIGNDDSFIRKHNSSGDVLWTEQFGTTDNDYAYAAATDSNGDVYVVGHTQGVLFGTNSLGDYDAFIRKYSSAGDILWTDQFGTSANDIIHDVAIDQSGNIYVGGYTRGGLPGASSLGDYDAFIRKYNSAGNIEWTNQFGTSLLDVAFGIETDSGGNVYVAGYTDGTLPGEASTGGHDSYLMKYDSSGTLLWTDQFGSTEQNSYARSLTLDSNDNVYVAGSSRGAIPGGTAFGDWDNYLRKYDSSGNLLWTDQFGTSLTDRALSLTSNSEDNVYLTGWVDGTLPGETSAGGSDTFIRQYNGDGSVLLTQQLGTSGADRAYSIADDPAGNIYLAGDTDGTLPDQSYSGGMDAFIIKFGSTSPDTTAPTTIIANPLEGQAVSGSIDISAIVDDSQTGNSNITEATYSIDGGAPLQMSASDGSFDSPAENVTAQLDTTTLSNGPHTITVTGKDSVGNWGTPATVSINVNNTILPANIMPGNLIFSNYGLNAIQEFDPLSKTVVQTIPVPAPYAISSTLELSALVRQSDHGILVNVRDGNGNATVLALSNVGQFVAAQSTGGSYLQQIAFDPLDPFQSTVLGGTPFSTGLKAFNPYDGIISTRITDTGNFIGIVTDESGQIFAGDNWSGIRLYSSNGTYQGLFADVASTTGNGEINSMTRDSDGNIYAAQNTFDRIAKYDSSGSFIGFITNPGFNRSISVFYNPNDNLLYVGNASDGKLIILTTSGVQVDVIDLGGQFLGVPGLVPGGQMVDSIPPNLLITSPLEGQVVSSNININATIDDSQTGNSNIAEATYSVDGGAPVQMTPTDGAFNSSTENVTAQLDTTSLIDGSHTLTVTGKDSAGNWSTVASVNVNVSNSTLIQGLAAYYTFNGNANDESGNGNNGTIYGASFAADRYGNLNKALSFDGVDDYVHVPDSPSLDMSSQISVETWVNISSPVTTTMQTMIRKQGAYLLEPQHPNEPHPNAQVFGVWTNGVFKGAWGTNPLETGQWHHVVGTYDGAFLRLYVNGELNASVPHTGQIDISNNPLYFAKGAGETFKGIIDDAFIYNRALTSEEVQQRYMDGQNNWNGPGVYMSRVSVDSQGGETTGCTFCHSSSNPDNKYVAFDSSASNLISNDNNGSVDVFQKNMQTGNVARVSVNASGEEANSDSRSPSSTPDGRYVAFQSLASNLVSGDDNGTNDIYRKDLQTGEIVRVTTNASGQGADGNSEWPRISADGRYVVFESWATNLVSDDTNGTADIFVKDLQDGTIVRASSDSSGLAANGESMLPYITSDGRYVGFESTASNLVDNDTNNKYDIFRKDLQTGELVRVSTSSGGGQGNDDSVRMSMTPDGRYATFVSASSNLISGDTNWRQDIFRKDLLTGELIRVSTNSNGQQANEASWTPSMSSDGRYVVFRSYASNLSSNDTNNAWDVFRKDTQTGRLIRVSVNAQGEGGNDFSESPTISSDGRYVVFVSQASNLITDDTNGTTDVFLADLTLYPPDITGPSVVVSYPYENQFVAGNIRINALISDDSGVAEAWYSFDGTSWSPLVFSGSSYSATADTTTLTDGLNALTVKAKDTEGNWSPDTAVNVVVGNANYYWSQTNTDGFGSGNNKTATSLMEFNGFIYSGGTNNITGGKMHRSSDGINWEQVNIDGYGDRNNVEVWPNSIFNGYLYASVWNEVMGAEIWRTADGTSWEQVNVDGFGDRNNIGAGAYYELNGYLYAGTWNNVTGGEIWRTADGLNWEQVNIDGFGDINNISTKLLSVFNGYIYAGTDNSVTGVEIWRTADGLNWEQVNIDGFGSLNNRGAPDLQKVFNGNLYIGTGNNPNGAEIWRTSDGTNWEQVISGGFGDTKNRAIKPSGIYNGYLYAGASNFVTGAEIWRTSDGTTWEQVNVDGFGDANNVQTKGLFLNFRGSLYLGTQNNFTGGEIWKYTEYNNEPVASFSINPNPALCGEPVSFDASASSHGRPDRQIVKYEWDFDYDGTIDLTSASPDATHIYEKAGSYTVRLRVTDNNSPAKTAVVTKDLTVINREPIANAGGPYVVDEGSVVTLDASASTDPDNDSIQYRWDLDGDGIWDTNYSSSSTTANTWYDDYIGVVKVEVTDGDMTDIASTLVTVNNAAPVVDAGNDQMVDEGSTVQLSGSATDAGINDSLSYEWDFGDGSAEFGANVSHVYNDSGVYTVTLTVTDDDGGIGQDTLTVDVKNIVPIANAGIDQSIHLGNLITLDGSGSSDPDGDTISYQWSVVSQPVGSSITLSDNTLVNPTFNPVVKGDYVFELTVRDSEGAVSQPDQVTVSSVNSAPVAEAGLDELITVIGSRVDLDGSQSYDADGDTLIYNWEFVSVPSGSNASITNANTTSPSFTADKHGDYVVKFTVTDTWGESSTDTVMVGFDNIKPVANAGLSNLITIGETAYLNGSGSTDANGDFLFYSWSLISVPQGSAASIVDNSSVLTSFFPDLPGTYVVQLIVSDGITDSDPSTVQINVITKQTAAILAADKVEEQIMNLEPVDFQNANMQNALINKINAAVSNIEAANYQDALNQLQNDILKKTDGVANTGQPDKNDWITDVESQNAIYPYVVALISKVNALI